MKYRNFFELTNRVAVVTGGAGILGQEFCAGLAEFGAKVAVVDLDKNKAEEFANNLMNKYNIASLGIGCDVSNIKSVKEMTERIENELGPISILHNNAATKGNSLEDYFTEIENYSMDTWREVMSVNLDGLFIVAKEIGARMVSRGKGSIIQTASIYGGVTSPDQRIYDGAKYMDVLINTPAVYSASKGGVLALSNHLATCWAESGVRVNTLSPGGVSSGQNSTFTKNYSRRIPLGRMAEKHEMVNALVFLASDASSYITGHNLIVDGGLSAW